MTTHVELTYGPFKPISEYNEALFIINSTIRDPSDVSSSHTTTNPECRGRAKWMNELRHSMGWGIDYPRPFFPNYEKILFDPSYLISSTQEKVYYFFAVSSSDYQRNDMHAVRVCIAFSNILRLFFASCIMQKK